MVCPKCAQKDLGFDSFQFIGIGWDSLGRLIPASRQPGQRTWLCL